MILSMSFWLIFGRIDANTQQQLHSIGNKIVEQKKFTELYHSIFTNWMQYFVHTTEEMKFIYDARAFTMEYVWS